VEERQEAAINGAAVRIQSECALTNMNAVSGENLTSRSLIDEVDVGVKKGDGRDLCHAALGAAYGSMAALDKHWQRRIGVLPGPNGLARIYSRNELDQLVDDLETAAKQAEVRRAATR
jgi:hypothetical protein